MILECKKVQKSTEVANNPNKNGVIPKTSKSGISFKPVPKIYRRKCRRIRKHLNIFPQHICDVESLAMRLINELNSMKDIMDDMLRSQ